MTTTAESGRRRTSMLSPYDLIDESDRLTDATTAVGCSKCQINMFNMQADITTLVCQIDSVDRVIETKNNPLLLGLTAIISPPMPSSAFTVFSSLSFARRAS